MADESIGCGRKLNGKIINEPLKWKNGDFMEGIRFVTDERGHRTAVQIDLNLYGELWEDIYDTILARMRKNEPRETLESVKERLLKDGKPRE